MEINKTFIVCDVEFKLISGPVGINCSGGADSAILLYILMLNHSEKIHVFTYTSSYTSSYKESSKFAIDVVNKCIELTGNNNIEHHIDVFCKTNTTDIIQPEEIKRQPKEYVLKKEIKVLYTGMTAAPPKEVHDNFIVKLVKSKYDKRDSSIIKDLFEDYFYMPFRNVDKKKIAELYEYYNLIESLFPLTRSCAWTVSIGGLYPGSGNCGRCFWCEERDWAFKKQTAIKPT